MGQVLTDLEISHLNRVVPASPPIKLGNILDDTLAGTPETDAVATADLQDASVTNAKLADNSVTTAKVENLAITTAKVNDLAITAGKLAAAVSAVIPGTPTLTVGSLTTHTRPTTVQMKDIAGNNLAAATLVSYWLSDAAGGVETATAPDTVAATTGTLINANRAITDASGVLVLAVTKNPTHTYYLNVSVGGKVTSSAAIAT